MGRQVSFFLHQDDQAEFDKLLKSLGDIVFMPYYHYDNKVSTVDDSIIRNIEKEESTIYVIRREDLKKVKLKHIENFGYWLIDDFSLPVIHFDRGSTKNEKIESGRLYYRTRYLDDDDILQKPEDFIKWADNIIKTVRRKLKKHKHRMGVYTYTAYLGEHAEKWREFHRANMDGGTALTSTIEN